MDHDIMDLDLTVNCILMSVLYYWFDTNYNNKIQ